MSMNSNIMGMQGPNLNNPCASPQVPPMHSEAKMVKREIFFKKPILFFYCSCVLVTQTAGYVARHCLLHS